MSHTEFLFAHFDATTLLEKPLKHPIIHGVYFRPLQDAQQVFSGKCPRSKCCWSLYRTFERLCPLESPEADVITFVSPLDLSIATNPVLPSDAVNSYRASLELCDRNLIGM
jgi:hypothetical protein